MEASQLGKRILAQTDIIFLLLFPFILALLFKSWLFLAPLAWIDPYLYTGYFLDLSKYVEVYGPTYYGSRLPWLLLGSGINSVFSFEVSNLILRFMLFYGATFSIYVSVRLAWGDRTAALLTAVMLGVTSPFLSAVSWDYPDGAVLTGMCITLALLTAAATTPQLRYALPLIFLAGFMTMMYVSTQLYVVVFAPLPVLWFIAMDRTHHKHKVYYTPITFILGGCAGFGLVGLLSNYVGGPFNYLQPQIGAIRSLNADAYLDKDYAWLKTAGHLIIPTLGVLVSTGLAARTFVLLARLRGRYKLMSRDDLTMGAAALLCTGLAVFYVYRYLIVVAPDVQYSFYTSYFLPYVFLAMGAALTLIVSKVSARTKAILGIFGTIALLAPFATEILRPTEQCFNPTCTIGEEGVMLAVVALLLVAGLMLRRIEPAIVGWLVFAVLNLGGSDFRFVRFENNGALYSQFLQIEHLRDRLEEYNKDGRLKFWLSNKDDPNRHIFVGVSSLHLYGFRIISADFPVLDPKHVLTPKERIAVLASHPDVETAAVEAIKSAGYNSRVLGSFQEDSGVKPYSVAILEVLLPDHSSPVLELDVSLMAAIPGASVARSSSEATVTTQSTRWAYAALLPMPVAVKDTYGSQPGFVQVEGITGTGTAGIGVLKADRSGWVSVAQFPGKQGTPFSVFLPIESLADTSDVIVMNWDRDGVSSGTVTRITVYTKDEKSP